MTRGWTRRELLQLAAAAPALAAWPALAGAQADHPQPQRKALPNPKAGRADTLPVIGMGTSQTFNVGSDPKLRAERTEVLRAFFARGGGMVDCSPMYGSSAAVLGHALQQLDKPAGLYSAEKVWTDDGDATRAQVAEQARLWGLPRFDLMQVHNLRATQPHLRTLRAMQEAGELRHIGVTTSHGRRHEDLAALLRREPLDFVQLSYSIAEREVESRLLPLAQDRGIAVIANRPYARGHLIKGLQRKGAAVPEWARVELECRNWADFLLRFIVSHPAVTVAIPATTKVAHMHENMAAGAGPMPDAKQRQRMIRDVEAL